jgi:hypothetical protein
VATMLYTLWASMSNHGSVAVAELSPAERVEAGRLVQFGLARVTDGRLVQTPLANCIDRWTAMEKASGDLPEDSGERGKGEMDDEDEQFKAAMDAAETKPAMAIRLSKWDGEQFHDWEGWTIEEPWAERTRAEWFGIVSAHIPRYTPVGHYKFQLVAAAKVVAVGEFGWDGSTATPRTGVPS